MTLFRNALAGCALALSLSPVALAETATLAPAADLGNVVAARSALTADLASDWRTYFENSFFVARGYSYSPVIDFGPAGVAVDALKLELFVARGDVCSAAAYSIDVATSPNQVVLERFFPNAEGVVALPNATVYKALFILQQSAIFQSRCTVRLSGLAHGGGTDTDNPGTGDFQMLGAVSYAGGLSDLKIAVGGAKVSQFWVRVPPFCGGVEILEAGTITEGEYDKARVVDAAKGIFEVNGGAGTRASEVRLILNGPRSAMCDLPVYIK